MYFTPTRALGACMMIFTVSLFGLQVQQRSHICNAATSQKACAVLSASAPATQALGTQSVSILATDASSQKSPHKQNAQKLTQLFKKLVAHDDEETTDLFDFGQIAEREGNLTLAADFYNQAAAQANEGALYHLPKFYKKHKNSFSDAAEKRFNSLIKIVQTGDSFGYLPDTKTYCKIARCYETGSGVKKRYFQSF